MSELSDIESGVIGLVSAVQQGGQPVFASVAGGAAADRRSAVALVRSMVMPAVLVVVGQREGAGGAPGSVGDERVTVLVSGQSLRSADGARIGDVDSAGAFALAELVTAVLEGAVLSGVWRFVGVAQQVVSSDERTVIIEQRWLARRPADIGPPMFGGAVVTGSDAVVTMEVGARASRSVSFAFAGVDGAFRHVLGVDSRVIVWRGLLRAVDHATLSGVEAGLEQLVAAGPLGDVTDGLGQSFERCVAESFDREGPRRIEAVTGRVVQAFTLRFVQLAGSP